jgi:hypothetical protein
VHNIDGAAATVSGRRRPRDALPLNRAPASAPMVEGTMPKPAELREISRLAREDAADESCPQLRQRLAQHAFALAQLAEKIEREEAEREAS